MKKIYIALLFLLHIGILFSQEQKTIIGHIKDVQTGSPIAYATVSYELVNTQGTISNDVGGFELFDVPLGTTIKINHLLYETQSYTITNYDSIEINLAAAILELPTAIADGKYAIQLAQKALEKAIASEQIYSGKGFYRQLSKIDGQYTEAIESFVNIHFSNKKIESWEVIEGRYGKIKKEDMLRFTNFSYFSRGFPIYDNSKKRKKKKNIAYIALSKKLNEFDVQVDQFLQKANGQEIAIVHCIPKDKSANKNSLFIESWHYIDTETYEIYKMKSIIPHPMGAKPSNPNFQIREPLYTFQFTYKKDLERGMVLDFIQCNGNLSLYENEKFAYTVDVNSLFYCYAIFGATQDTFGKTKKKIDDLDVASKAAYNPAFWEKHPILKKTPLEKKVLDDFEAAGFFGNFLDNGN